MIAGRTHLERGVVERIQHRQRVIAILDEMAPDLLRINPDAAETAALVVIRLQHCNDQERLRRLLRANDRRRP